MGGGRKAGDMGGRAARHGHWIAQVTDPKGGSREQRTGHRGLGTWKGTDGLCLTGEVQAAAALATVTEAQKGQEEQNALRCQSSWGPSGKLATMFLPVL